MSVDREVMYDAYNEVRSDDNDTAWATFKYQDKVITLDEKGEKYEDFLDRLGEDERVYAFVRFETGDEMSKRAKFALITWVGPKTSVLKKAKVSTDKAFVKEIIQSYAKEFLADQKSDLDYDSILEEVKATGGANYGTGVRKE